MAREVEGEEGGTERDGQGTDGRREGEKGKAGGEEGYVRGKWYERENVSEKRDGKGKAGHVRNI